MEDNEAMTSKGTLYGLGVGPGDPELMTVKAWRIIGSVEVIAWPRTASGDHMARTIAAPFVPEDVIELPIDVPMEKDRKPARDAYDKACQAIAAHLDEGRHVAFLTVGDPFFYGSFMYIHQRLQGSYKVTVVPGITSLSAAAMASGRPLAARNDVLRIVPATLDDDRLRGELAGAEALAIIKVGKHFAKVRRHLTELMLLDKAVLVEAATLGNERVRPLASVDEDFQPYFSTILVYNGGEPW